MNKESYIRDSEASRIDMDAAYQMYLDVNRDVPKVDFNQFIALFTQWIRYNQVILDKYFVYWNEKYEITEKGEL